LTPTVLAGFLESAQTGTLAVAGQPQCSVSVYKRALQHHRRRRRSDRRQRGHLRAPAAAHRAAIRDPVLLYAHGTSLQKSYDMADIANNTEARLAAAVFAAQGFIVVAPNYAGYGGSSLGYHPYLDRIAGRRRHDRRPARGAQQFTAIGARDSGKLMVTGYSQGGYVALATQRAMQDLGTPSSR
jgi:pimeloyl-ACP methyl ester carboxylesterase